MGTRVFLGIFLAMLAVWPTHGSAQAPDGFHQSLVFPVVVHSGSFTQQFHFTRASSSPLFLKPVFYPAEGTQRAALGPLTCPTISLSEGRVTVQSLAALCPGIGSGSVFGFLVVESDIAPYDWLAGNPSIFAGFSRVTNPQGNGFSVDSVASNTLGIGYSVIQGMKRKAATAGSPAFQSNCFVGRMPEREPGAMASLKVDIWVAKGTANYMTSVNLAPGGFVRFLDIFAAAGVPPGDVPDSDVMVLPDFFATEKVGVIAFCTLQDNTSFGADFRLAKWHDNNRMAPPDNLARRLVIERWDALGREFAMPPGQFANTHLLYLRNPDYVSCSLYRSDSIPLTASAGLELRLLDSSGAVVAGGTDVVGFAPVYLGDKARRGGRNARYLLEVESSGLREDEYKGYSLWCATGSGMTSGLDIVRYNEPIDRF